MPHTPTQRATRSNSTPQANITLLEIKSLIEKSKQDIIETLETKVDKQTSMIASLLKRVDDLTGANIQLERKCNLLEEKLVSLPKSTFEEIEDRDRRKMNLIISGVPGKTDGSVEERKAVDAKFVKGLLEDLSVFNDGMRFQTYRIGKPSKGGHRLLKVAFCDLAHKQDVLWKAKHLRDMPSYRHVYINPDLTFLQRQDRKLLMEELKARREAGDDVMIRNGKIVSRHTIQNFH